MLWRFRSESQRAQRVSVRWSVSLNGYNTGPYSMVQIIRVST